MSGSSCFCWEKNSQKKALTAALMKLLSVQCSSNMSERRQVGEGWLPLITFLNLLLCYWWTTPGFQNGSLISGKVLIVTSTLYISSGVFKIVSLILPDADTRNYLHKSCWVPPLRYVRCIKTSNKAYLPYENCKNSKMTIIVKHSLTTLNEY